MDDMAEEFGEMLKVFYFCDYTFFSEISIICRKRWKKCAKESRLRAEISTDPSYLFSREWKSSNYLRVKMLSFVKSCNEATKNPIEFVVLCYFSMRAMMIDCLFP